MGQCLGKEKDPSGKKVKKGPAGVFRLSDNLNLPPEHESLMARNPNNNGMVPLDTHPAPAGYDDEKVIKLSEPIGLRESSSDDEVDAGDARHRAPSLGGRGRDVTSSDEDVVVRL